jgi:hypothetical protein
MEKLAIASSSSDERAGPSQASNMETAKYSYALGRSPSSTARRSGYRAIVAASSRESNLILPMFVLSWSLTVTAVHESRMVRISRRSAGARRLTLLKRYRRRCAPFDSVSAGHVRRQFFASRGLAPLQRRLASFPRQAQTNRFPRNRVAERLSRSLAVCRGGVRLLSLGGRPSDRRVRTRASVRRLDRFELRRDGSGHVIHESPHAACSL